MAYESYEDAAEWNRPGDDQQYATEDDPMASYTPQQRRVILKGMRILARVASPRPRTHATAGVRVVPARVRDRRQRRMSHQPDLPHSSTWSRARGYNSRMGMSLNFAPDEAMVTSVGIIDNMSLFYS